MKKLLLALLLFASIRSFASDEVSLRASYIYWLAGEEGLGLGRSGSFAIGDDPFFNSSTVYLSQPFQYQSGFKVGADWERNEWSLVGEYTWIRNNTSLNSSAPLPNPNTGTGVWLIAPWFIQIAQDGGTLSGTQVGSTWRLAMDIGDLYLSRSYSPANRLILYPFGGLRAAWIRQKMDISLTEPPDLFPTIAPQPIHSSTGSHSWSIGPRFGSEAHLCLGCGLRFEGNLALSLLFTEYTRVFHKEDSPSPDTLPGVPIYAEVKNQSALRPVLETGLGLGWSSSITDRCRIDLSATYDFMLWWNQNMMREFLNSLWNQSFSNGDLYLHGLTLSSRFTF